MSLPLRHLVKQQDGTVREATEQEIKEFYEFRDKGTRYLSKELYAELEAKRKLAFNNMFDAVNEIRKKISDQIDIVNEYGVEDHSIKTLMILTELLASYAYTMRKISGDLQEESDSLEKGTVAEMIKDYAKALDMYMNRDTKE